MFLIFGFLGLCLGLNFFLFSFWFVLPLLGLRVFFFWFFCFWVFFFSVIFVLPSGPALSQGRRGTCPGPPLAQGPYMMSMIFNR